MLQGMCFPQKGVEGVSSVLILMHLQLAQNLFRDVRLDGIAAAKLVCCQGWNHFNPAIMEHWLETRGFGSSLSLSISSKTHCAFQSAPGFPNMAAAADPTPRLLAIFRPLLLGGTSGYEFDFSDLLKSRFFPLCSWLPNSQEVCCHAS